MYTVIFKKMQLIFFMILPRERNDLVWIRSPSEDDRIILVVHISVHPVIMPLVNEVRLPEYSHSILELKPITKSYKMNSHQLTYLQISSTITTDHINRVPTLYYDIVLLEFL